MKKFPGGHKWTIAGVLLGAAAGFAYWYFVGCTGGTCAITSRPLNSTLYGAMMGYLVSGVAAPGALGKNEKQKTDSL